MQMLIEMDHTTLQFHLLIVVLNAEIKQKIKSFTKEDLTDLYFIFLSNVKIISNCPYLFQNVYRNMLGRLQSLNT